MDRAGALWRSATEVRSSAKSRLVCRNTCRSTCTSNCHAFYTLFPDTPTITTTYYTDDPEALGSCVPDGGPRRYRYVRICIRALDSPLVSHVGGESNHAITRDQYALAAQIEAGKVIVTIAIGLLGSVNACRMFSWSRQWHTPFLLRN